MNTAAAMAATTDSVEFEPFQSKGTVLWFSKLKGYGFIHCETQQEKVFVYHANIEMEGFKFLDGGDKVEFKVGDLGKGPAAFNVRRLQ